MVGRGRDGCVLWACGLFAGGLLVDVVGVRERGDAWCRVDGVWSVSALLTETL